MSLTEDEIVVLFEKQLDLAVDLYASLKRRDRTEGIDHDEAALGGVAMFFVAGTSGAADLTLLASLAVRRLAQVEAVTDA